MLNTGVGDGIESLLKYNRSQSDEYCSVDAVFKRRVYRQSHPTAICALKCMDGRLNLPVITNTPAGIIQPMRTIGGRFDLGWPHFGDVMSEWMERSFSENRSCLVLASYHFSKGSKDRGCKGFGYDTKSAIKYTQKLREQFERVYGMQHVVLYPVQIGIETDEDAIIVHGHNGDRLNIAEVTDATQIEGGLKVLFPDMSHVMRSDFAHLLEGNFSHIAEIRTANRPTIDIEHRESIIGIGRGYDWLHMPNIALLVGAFDYNLAASVKTASDIIKSNLEEGRLDSQQDMVLMSSSPCWKPRGTYQWNQMVEKANSLALLAHDAIKDHNPELLQNIKILVGVVDMHTRLFVPQEFPGPTPLK